MAGPAKLPLNSASIPFAVVSGQDQLHPRLDHSVIARKPTGEIPIAQERRQSCAGMQLCATRNTWTSEIGRRESFVLIPGIANDFARIRKYGPARPIFHSRPWKARSACATRVHTQNAVSIVPQTKGLEVVPRIAANPIANMHYSEEWRVQQILMEFLQSLAQPVEPGCRAARKRIASK